MGLWGVRPATASSGSSPPLPPQITRLCFNVGYRGASVAIDVADGHCTVTAHPNVGPVRVGLAGEVVELAPGESRRVPVSRR